jgi:hypothetical protein
VGFRDEDVDNLAELVDRPIQIDPPSGDFDISFVDESPITGGMPAGPGRIHQQWSEPLHPPLHTHVIDLDVPLGQQLLHVTVREPIAQVPAHRQRDHRRREPEPGEA